MKDLLNGNFVNPMVPEWLKTTLLNFNDIKRKPPEEFTEDMIKNESTLNVVSNTAQLGGLLDIRKIRQMNQNKLEKLDKRASEKEKRITKNMKSASKDIKRNNTLYGDQPSLKRPNRVENRFTIQN